MTRWPIAVARRSLVPVIVATAQFWAGHALAMEGERCSGPAACCPTELVENLKTSVTVGIGVVLVGLNEANERSGTWNADLYLYETWPVTPGFSPQTEVVNEVARATESSDFDLTTLDGSTCSRTRRLRLTLHTRYNLRRFPFDRQRLELQLSDSEFDASTVSYANDPITLGIDDKVRDQLSAWRVEGNPEFQRETREFRWEPGHPKYDYATFAVHARRHVSFHIARFFLPLLLLVMIAFGQFWVDPGDINSQLTVGITCLLAVIALQFAEGSNLPDVAYLTFADRIYVLSYVAITGSILEAFYTNQLVRIGKPDLALRVDRASRVIFPLAVALGVVAATIVSFSLSAA